MKKPINDQDLNSDKVFRVDLHTHSFGSPDGGMTVSDYGKILTSGRLDYVAITDHGGIDTALYIVNQLPDFASQIVVGQEIMTSSGEIVGLYLTDSIPDGLTPEDAVMAIKKQNGLVYIPHPFETVRKGLPIEKLNAIADTVDIVEVRNGRAILQDYGSEASSWASGRSVAMAASSDAHGKIGWGRTATIVDEMPNRESLVHLLRTGRLDKRTVGAGILYPKLNRLRKRNLSNK